MRVAASPPASALTRASTMSPGTSSPLARNSSHESTIGSFAGGAPRMVTTQRRPGRSARRESTFANCSVPSTTTTGASAWPTM